VRYKNPLQRSGRPYGGRGGSLCDIPGPSTDMNDMVFDPASCTYMRPLPTREPEPARPCTVPLNDGSRVFWRYAYWTVEAFDFDRAWVEIKRLCSDNNVRFIPRQIREV
jgi:hypothetical protein